MRFAPIFAALAAQRLRRRPSPSSRSTTCPTAPARPRSPPATCAASANRSRHPASLKEHTMATRRLGLIMHGVTGRMGMNQHLIRSICAIRAQGGVTLANGDRVMPDPILIGRNAEKIEALAKAHGIARWGTDLDAALADKDDTVFFDAGTTQMRPQLLAKRARAPASTSTARSRSRPTSPRRSRSRASREASGLKHGAVQDKLFLPGLRKLDMLRRAGFFGRMLSVRLEFGYWVFEGDLQPIQRPSLELPRGRRRRHDPRHDVPLALRARQPVRRGAVGLVPGRDAHPEALGRGRPALRRDRRRRRLRDRAARRATAASR